MIGALRVNSDPSWPGSKPFDTLKSWFFLWKKLTLKNSADDKKWKILSMLIVKNTQVVMSDNIACSCIQTLRDLIHRVINTSCHGSESHRSLGSVLFFAWAFAIQYVPISYTIYHGVNFDSDLHSLLAEWSVKFGMTQEDQNDPKSPTWVSDIHCSNCTCIWCRN